MEQISERIRREKIKQAMLGRKHTWGDKISASMIGNQNGLGHVLSEEAKKKIAESNSKTVREKVENGTFISGMRGKHHSEEVVDKIRESRIEQYKNGWIHPMLGKHHSEDSIKLMQDTVKEKLENGTFVKGMLGKTQSKETRAILRKVRCEMAHKAKPKYTSLEIFGYEKLTQCGISFIPQANIDDRFIADAFIPYLNMIVEFQGVYWHNLPEVKERDEIKFDYYKSRGYKVLEIWEDQIDEWNPIELMSNGISQMNDIIGSKGVYMTNSIQ